MRVLIAIHGFPPTFYAGSERAAERIALWLVEHGHEVDVFCLEKLDDPVTRMVTRSERGMTIHRLHLDQGVGDSFQNYYDNPVVGEHFRKLLAEKTFDVMHMVSGYLLGEQVIAAAKAAKIPVVLTLTEFWMMCFRLNLLTVHNEMCIGPETDAKCARCILEDQRRFRVPSQAAPAVMNAFWKVAEHLPFATDMTEAVQRRRENLMRAVASADRVICPSYFLMNKFREYGFDMSRAAYLLYGIRQPNEDHKEAAFQRRHPGQLRLGYVGQIKAHKGVDLLIDAVIPLLDSQQPISLELWGSSAGAEKYGSALQERTTAYPAIQWKGSYNADQLWDVLGGFDVLVVPSRWFENSPTVILEAQSLGLPVIATRLGSMPELINYGENGLLFDLNNAKDLRDQIARLLDERDLLRQLRNGIPATPTIDDEVGAIFRHYQQLTSRG
jgi:glycosyltransferase involved in cell wall biosynthesis